MLFGADDMEVCACDVACDTEGAVAPTVAFPLFEGFAPSVPAVGAANVSDGDAGGSECEIRDCAAPDLDATAGEIGAAGANPALVEGDPARSRAEVVPPPGQWQVQ